MVGALKVWRFIPPVPVPLPDLYRRGVGHQPPDDHLPVAHVVLFDLRAFADPAQLHERVARVAFVLGAHDLVLVAGPDDAELGQPGISDEVQGDEIGA